ncbi:MAG TPA: GNAT family N-acetyltransferase [Candidatus Limnocylindrales bacterium]|nr:GNAT family N-acetyltransferase [Candidatus Limnocylindrales bacterium]
MTEPSSIPVVRPATAADARSIAEIRIASWRATYAGIVPAAILERMDLARNEAFFGGLIAAEPPRATLVVEDAEGRIAGFALAAPSRDDDAPGCGEIEAIYLRPEARGRGLGRPLLDAAAASLLAAGFGTVVLWVLTANVGARRFYERAGFGPDGTARMLDFDGTPIEEIRYRRG